MVKRKMADKCNRCGKEFPKQEVSVSVLHIGNFLCLCKDKEKKKKVGK